MTGVFGRGLCHLLQAEVEGKAARGMLDRYRESSMSWVAVVVNSGEGGVRDEACWSNILIEEAGW